MGEFAFHLLGIVLNSGDTGHLHSELQDDTVKHSTKVDHVAEDLRARVRGGHVTVKRCTDNTP